MPQPSRSYLVGIDVGGTFTDILCLDIENQKLLSAKTPSLPGKQWEGVLKRNDMCTIKRYAMDIMTTNKMIFEGKMDAGRWSFMFD